MPWRVRRHLRRPRRGGVIALAPHACVKLAWGSLPLAERRARRVTEGSHTATSSPGPSRDQLHAWTDHTPNGPGCRVRLGRRPAIAHQRALRSVAFEPQRRSRTWAEPHGT